MRIVITRTSAKTAAYALARFRRGLPAVTLMALTVLIILTIAIAVGVDWRLSGAVAAALGVYAKVPHGLACAMMLPVALRVNRVVAEKALAELALVLGRWVELRGVRQSV